MFCRCMKQELWRTVIEKLLLLLTHTQQHFISTTRLHKYSFFVIRTCMICVIYSPSLRYDYDPLNLYYNHDHVVLHCLFGLCSKENSTNERLGQQEQQSTKYKNYCTYIIVYWCTTTTLTTKTNSYSKDHQGLIKRWIQLIKYFKWRVLDDKNTL